MFTDSMTGFPPALILTARRLRAFRRLRAPRAVILELARESRGTKATTWGHLQQDGSSFPATPGLAPPSSSRYWFAADGLKAIFTSILDANMLVFAPQPGIVIHSKKLGLLIIFIA